MISSRGRLGTGTSSMSMVMLVLLLGLGDPALAQQAVRDMPALVSPSETFLVTITLTPPGATGVAAVEDRPPSGWTVSNISDSGSFDGSTQSVKWGPFFDPSIPASVSYEVTAPPIFSGTNCFAGIASYDGNDVDLSGDLCLPPPVPAASTWGLVVLAMLVAGAGTIALRRERVSGADRAGA